MPVFHAGASETLSIVLKHSVRPESIRPDGFDLRLAIERSGDSMGDAIGVCRMYTSEPIALDITGLSLMGNTLSGTLKATLKDRKGNDQPCSYTLSATISEDIVSGNYSGSFGSRSVEGSVDGEMRPTIAYSSVSGIDLYLNKALVPASPGDEIDESWSNAVVSVRLESGSVTFVDKANAAISRGLLPDHWSKELKNGYFFSSRGPCFVNTNEWYSNATECDLTLDDNGTISGTVRDTVQWFGDKPGITTGEYIHTLTGKAIGNIVYGTFSTTVNGSDVGEETFAGEIVENAWIPPDPRNSVYSIQLLEAIAEPQGPGVDNCKRAGCAPMKVYVSVSDGNPDEVIAHSWYNRMNCPVEVTTFDIDDRNLRLDLRITIPTDPNISFPAQPKTTGYSLTGRLMGTVLSGDYSGTFHGKPREGKLYGRYYDRSSQNLSDGILSEFKDAELTGTQAKSEHLRELSLIDSREPVISGERRDTTFWNDFRYDYQGLAGGLSHHIFPPNFSFEPVNDASSYRISVEGKTRSYSFTTNDPGSNLSPIWDSIPSGQTIVYKAKLQGLDGNSDTIPGSSQTRLLVKRPSFQGPYAPTPSNRRDRLDRYLKSFLQDFWSAPYRSDFTTGNIASGSTRPSPVRAIATMIPLLQLSERTKSDADRHLALKTARNNGDSWRDYSSRQTGYVIPGHWKNEYWQSVWGAISLVELYRVTGEETWLDMAGIMANTYRSLQSADGDFRWRGEPGCGNIPFETINPAPFLYFFGKLRNDGNTNEYIDVEEKAYGWLLENTARNLEWPNLWGCSHHWNYLNFHWETALFFCSYMIEYAPEEKKNSTLLHENARWVEDQFIAWNRFPEAYNYRITPPVPPYSDSHRDHISSAGNAWLAYVYLNLYQQTSDTLLYAKAESLIDNLLWAQDAVTGFISPVLHHSGIFAFDSWTVPPEPVTALFLPKAIDLLDKNSAAKTPFRSSHDRHSKSLTVKQVRNHLGMPRIVYQTKTAGPILFQVFDLRGRSIILEKRIAKNNTVDVFSLPRDMAPGTYMVTITSGAQTKPLRLRILSGG